MERKGVCQLCGAAFTTSIRGRPRKVCTRCRPPAKDKAKVEPDAPAAADERGEGLRAAERWSRQGSGRRCGGK